MSYAENDEEWIKRVAFILGVATYKSICSEDEAMAIMRLCFRNHLKGPYKLTMKEMGY